VLDAKDSFSKQRLFQAAWQQLYPGVIEWVSLSNGGKVTKVEPFLTGLVENNGYLGRPVDVMVMKDGSLLVSDDHNGAVYRISYSR